MQLIKWYASDLIMKEYYLDPTNTALTVRDDWLYSGDLAKIDDEGFVFFFFRGEMGLDE